MSSAPEDPRPEKSGALREVLLYGLAGGAVLAVLALAQARFLPFGRPSDLYAGLVATVFAGLGIWLGVSVRRRRPAGLAERGPEGEAFTRDEDRLNDLGITPRELEILEQIAAGLSNRGIATALFVSENTVKTHAKRLFDKLGARRRTEAVRIARANRLIP